LLILNAHFFL
jgi:hypothetical protein